MSVETYSVTWFKTLRESYPQWSDFSQYITSQEGGSLVVADESEKDNLCIIRYIKGHSDFSKQHVRWFRSVVWDKYTNMPVCVAPPKASVGVPDGTLNTAYNDFQCQPFIDGTMINSFKIAGIYKCFIATRSKIGATGSFYSDRSFADMFQDAVDRLGVGNSTCYNDPVNNEDVATFTSYVLQHPENRIVSEISSPKLFQIHTGEVKTDGTVIITEGSYKIFGNYKKLYIPEFRSHVNMNDKDINKWFELVADTMDHNWKGVVFKDGYGGRWKFVSPKYNANLALRGNEAGSLDRFIRLRQEKLVGYYLEYYKEDCDRFWRLEKCVRVMTCKLYEIYTSIHKLHEHHTDALERCWKQHVYAIHGIFKNILQPSRQSVNIKVVIEYVNSLSVKQLQYLMKNVTYPWKTEEVPVVDHIELDGGDYTTPVSSDGACYCAECYS